MIELISAELEIRITVSKVQTSEKINKFYKYFRKKKKLSLPGNYEEIPFINTYKPKKKFRTV